MESVRALHLPRHRERAAQEIDVLDLNPRCLTEPQPSESTQTDKGRNRTSAAARILPMSAGVGMVIASLSAALARKRNSLSRVSADDLVFTRRAL